jgi:hypothetical protein
VSHRIVSAAPGRDGQPCATRPLHIRRIAALCASCILLAGCKPPAEDPGGSPAQQQGAVPEWTLSPEPLLDIGGEGQKALFMVTSAARTPSGGVLVANAGTGELRWFDASGQFLRAAGRRGGGPGEFQHIGWVGMVPGDSVAAWDPVLRRLSIFGAEGRFARAVPIPARGPLATLVGPLDGALLVATRIHVEPAEDAGVWRDSLLFLRVHLAGEVLDTVGRFPGTEWYADATGNRVQTRPLGKQTVAAVAENAFYVGTGDGYEVGAYGADGTPRGKIRKPHQPLRIAPRDRQAFLGEVVQVGGSEQDRQERTRMLADAPFPESMPPYTSLSTDAEGNLWVREMQRPGTTPETSRWSVFNPDGDWIATVRGPARFKAFQIGTDWVLGTQTDLDDAERVRVYRIRKG